MKLSIVLLYYNASHFIENTMNSIMKNHGVDDYEVILIDGNSDGELHVNKLDTRFKYCRISNNNPVDMYNTGLHLATGEYVYFMMAGDKLCEYFLPEAVDILDDTGYDIFTRNFISDGEEINAAYEELRVGPMLCTTVIRKSSIDIEFDGDACVDIIFTKRLLLRGALLYRDRKYNSIEHNEDAYWWITQQSNDFLNTMNMNWLTYVRTFALYTDDMINVSIHVEDKCNKNCIACGHFSPLVPENTPSMTFDEFMDTIRYLIPYRQHIRTLILTGGEPTLNPNLPQIIRGACDQFDRVRVVSNGLNPEFFAKYRNLIKETGVEVYVTNYNEELKDQARKNLDGVAYMNGYSISSLENEKGVREMFFSKMLSKQRIKDIDIVGKCGARGECCQLVGSKLYICQYVANFKYFDKFFKDHPLPKAEDSYIDLADGNAPYKIIRKFLYEHNCAMCWQCMEPYISKGQYDMIERVPLTHSKKEMSEWVG